MHNNRKTKNIGRKLLFALALIIFFGCQKEAIDPNDNNRPNTDGSVGFRLVSETDDFKTKGTPQKNLDNYSSVQVNVYSHKEDYSASNSDTKLFREIELEQKNGKWEYEPPMYWPTEYKLSFISYASDVDFAQAGITFTPTTGAAESITYKVPSEVAKQPDLLVSTKFNQQEIPNILLNMKHALACVSFSGVAPEEGTYVKKITLRNVCGEGTLRLNDATMTWQVNKDSYGVTVFEPGIDKDQELGEAPLVNDNYLMNADGYLMMVPQKLENAAIDVTYWNGVDDKNDKIVTYTLPVDKEEYATWRPGKSYIYRFGTQVDGDITVVYYERYADGYGLYYYDKGNLVETLDKNGTKEILEAGYGVLTKEKTDNVLPIRISSPVAAPVTSGTVVDLGQNSYLYPVSQSATSTFPLTSSTIPASVYFNGNDKSCGMIIPHFAKGVYTAKMAMKNHAIRTPQQMRNITSIGTSMIRGSNIYTQELNLDFSKTSIGGGDLVSSIVDCDFNDTFDGKGKKIENININTVISNGALFVLNGGVIQDVTLINPHITTSGNCGGIAAENKKDGEITRVRVIGNNETTPFLIQGSAYVGAIVGLNSGKITGNTTIEVATEIPVAEVSGWGTVRGSTQATGGVAGNNIGTITTCLVNGVYVTGPEQGNAQVAKITIESAGNYVGGIVGANSGLVDGNYSINSGVTQAEPDIAGIVSVSGNDFVGGIAGENKGTLNRVNVRLGRGDATKAITISGQQSVGGIVGYNESGGVLKADGNSFISVRGNVIITGSQYVGGIVGNNQKGNISNCFVYNFYSQSTTAPLTHYAPKIKGTNKVGGIVGLAGEGNITKCSIFSTVSDANKGNGDATNAIAEVTCTGTSVGGIVGHGISGINIYQSFVLGNVNINGVNNCGGIVGENDPQTSITSVHIGNSGQEISDIYTKLFKVVKLPVDDLRMQTGGGAMTNTSGTPTISGATYVGGICGVNWGSVKDILLKDNVIIGSVTSDWVGGISGGNGLNATISNCKVYNPAGVSSVVKILGRGTIGGITGINNGIVNLCQLGMPGKGASRLIEIKGSWTVGGIAGINGGNEKYFVEDKVSGNTIPGTGNDKTTITDCNVYGKVTIEANERVGGIIGQNGITNKIVNCNVIGYESSYTDPNTHTHDITLKADASVGGIAGYNYGEIYGTSTKSSTVTHTAIIGNSGYSGGLVGVMKAVKTGDEKNTPFESKLYYCDVSYGVLVYFLRIRSGAFAGLLDGIEGSDSKPTLFGTVAGSITNRIYTGTANRVVIDGNGTLVKPQSSFPLPYWEKPDVEHTLGNLWVYYQMGNYLHYTTYQ